MSESAPSSGSRTIAVVFSRLGPYHVARLRGAADVLARCGVGLHAIAIAGSDRVYAWDPVAHPSACPTDILFEKHVYEDIAAADVAGRLQACLDRLDPLAVALPGWAFTEARAGLRWCQRRKRSAILMSESSKDDHARVWPKEIVKGHLVRQFGAALVGGSRHREYARELGLPRAAIFYGYDVVDNEYFITGAARARADAETVRAKRKLPARYFLTSSRFIPKKNIDGLLRAYALYANTVPHPRDLVVCGDGPLRDRLHRIARDLGLGSRVHWPGFIQYPDLPDYYALADAFILASTTEQWGLVVNEAMAAALPVLVSERCGSAPDLVRPGVNGWMFDPFLVDSIADALRKLPEDRAVLGELGAASRRIIDALGVDAFGRGLLEAARIALARIGRDDFGPPGGAG